MARVGRSPTDRVVHMETTCGSEYGAAETPKHPASEAGPAIRVKVAAVWSQGSPSRALAAEVL